MAGGWLGAVLAPSLSSGPLAESYLAGVDSVDNGNTKQTSLALMSEASRMLVEATTIQAAKELKDLALTAADWARRKGLGDEAIQYAREYASRAGRKMGEMLQATELQHGARGIGKSGVTTSNPTPILADLGITKRESSDAQLLASLSEEKFEDVATGKTTLADAKRESKPVDVDDEFDLGPGCNNCAHEEAPATSAHVSYNSGNNEWYTPRLYADAARRVMGSIDLDPASSPEANKIIQADTYYTIDNDGLKQSWKGCLWMNPPYAASLVHQFCEKLLNELPNIKQAIVLVNNATETGWFQKILEQADAVCFLKGRVKFLNEQGNPVNTPLQGQAILYFGSHSLDFNSEFSKLGQVLTHA